MLEVDAHLADRVRIAEDGFEGFRKGDRVRVISGSFAGFEGLVVSAAEESGKVKLVVEIFSRSTPLEVEHWQLERI